MITHTIVKYKPRFIANTKKDTVTRPNFHGKIGSDAHKKYILERALDNCKYEKGEQVTYRRKEYLISDIYTLHYIEYVEWAGLSPRFLELVAIANGEVELVNPGEVTRSRKR